MFHPPLRNVPVHALDLALLQAGAGVKGEFELRLKALIGSLSHVGGSESFALLRHLGASRRNVFLRTSGDCVEIPSQPLGRESSQSRVLPLASWHQFFVRYHSKNGKPAPNLASRIFYRAQNPSFGRHFQKARAEARLRAFPDFSLSKLLVKLEIVSDT